MKKSIVGIAILIALALTGVIVLEEDSQPVLKPTVITPATDLCNSILPLSNLHNNPNDKNRINIVFLGYNFTKHNELKNLLNTIVINEDREGPSYPTGSLFTVTPYKEQKDKFNLYYIPYVIEPQRNWNRESTSCHCRSRAHQQQLEACNINNLEFIAVCNGHCTAIAGTDDHYFSIGFPKEFKNVRAGTMMVKRYKEVLTHEFSHSFGGLQDEYLNTQKQIGSLYPNCPESKEQGLEWWGDIFPNLKVYPGCTAPNLYRFQENSLMKQSSVLNFGKVNTYFLCNRILKVYGTPNKEYCLSQVQHTQ